LASPTITLSIDDPSSPSELSIHRSLAASVSTLNILITDTSGWIAHRTWEGETVNNEMLTRIGNAIVEFDTDSATRLVREALGQQVRPIDIIMKGIVRGLDEVGQKYESHEFFLAELIAAGTTANACIEILEPMLKVTEQASRGLVVVGTIEGDLHDIGKNLVAMMLLAQGFRVVDLGIDVPAAKFIESLRKEKPSVLALSCLLTTTMHRLAEVIEDAKKAQLRNQAKIIVGGGAVTPEHARSIGADGYAPDAIEAGKLARGLAA
jgi:corrinoid protein of di/trimethylamine methyltransferase